MIALNGFGRIGKTFLRTVLLDPVARKKIPISAINIGPGDIHGVAHDFTYDTIMGTFPGTVRLEGRTLVINDIKIPVLSETTIKKDLWKPYQVHWVVDASGHYTRRSAAEQHLIGGARRVLITAPAENEDITIVLGVNENAYQKEAHHIVSIGSCTTNAVVPTLKVLLDTFGIEQASLSTTHAYTNTQALLDANAITKDLRRSRAAALNIVPTTTGAMEVIGKVIPELNGKLTGTALRVPVPIVSLIDVAFIAQKEITPERINKVFEHASKNNLQGILDISTAPLVSSDFRGNSNSVVIDAALTATVRKLGHVFGWYDNEWGYCCRLKDFLLFAGF